MKLKNLAAASVVALTALSSQAASFNWGAHDAFEVGGNTVSGAVFDTFSFSLGTSSTLTSSVIANPGSFLGSAYTLYSSGADHMVGGGDDSFVGAWGFNTANTVALGSGSYYYSVLGGATGSSTYAISSVAAAVPEPETYALLGAGLGVIGFLASRRRRDS
ncbi:MULTISPECIES: FxDxF family PEP-CTERM protein [unclassified Roseateles]|uniref:FxDxF family PEP-CTERM protein n=1 Tax=Pelomonas sp. Root1237 TaxID=1736434 RepID=UPI0006F59E2F|nr:FxDxF family PEP-CTERM protein [Pelomonas sp. Root1237]KQV92276.1 hypothetical protein ASC91_06715 [Pelomonas sp. Root1237]